MTRIHPDYLRALLGSRAYRQAAVIGSLTGGWLVVRPKHLRTA